jgi:hypothetical protein
MRAIDKNTLNALYGSRSGDKVVVYAWYGGALAWPDPLPISAWAFNWDITRQVQKFSCAVTDESGSLAPWLLEDPLGVGGARLEVRYDVGGAGTINMGWYRISASTPSERWHSYVIDNLGQINEDIPLPSGKQLKMVPGGATIAVDAYDLALVAKKDRLLAPESPEAGSMTIVSEVTRLMKYIAPVNVAAGVADRNVARNIVYERDRLDAIQDLCKRIFCDFRMNGDGHLEIYPVNLQSAPVVLQGGPGGLLVSVDRAQDMEGLYNRFVVDGTKTNEDGSSLPIRSVAQIEDGPLSILGPHGRIPEFYSSTMIATQADADAYAQEMALTQLTGLTTDLQVVCLPLPHLQQGDWVQVANPMVDGEPVPLVGKVKTMTLKSGTGTAPAAMELTVQCSYWTVQSAIGSVKRRAY